SLQILYLPASDRPCPRFTSISAAEGMDRIPSASSVLQGHLTIPICNTIVMLNHDGKNYAFTLSYRYHPIFIRNCALQSLDSQVI
ncbi:hypothetical protein L208DRAFT_1282490, partial [Tricholoma matsutake]